MRRRLFAPLIALTIAVSILGSVIGCRGDSADVEINRTSTATAIADAGTVDRLPPTVVPMVATSSLGTDDAEEAGVPSRLSMLERETLPVPVNDLVDHRRLADGLLKQARTAEAISEYRQSLAVDASADVWGALGDAYLRVGEVDRGVACLQEAVTVDVDHLASRRLLARQYLSANQGELARQQAEEWVRLEPLSPSARQALGRAYAQLAMWHEAVDAFTLVVAAQPDNAYAHNNLGFAALQTGNNALAVEHLENILSLRPQEGYMLNNLGVAYERSGRAAEAHAAFARAAELSPRYAQAALNRDRLQRGLDQAQRIVSTDALARLREGAASDGMPLGGETMRVELPAMPTSTGE